MNTATNPNAPTPARPDDTPVLVIGTGFHIEGQVRGTGTVLVQGSLSGRLEAPAVKVAEGGRIQGQVQCAELDVAGRLDGSFETEDLVLRGTGILAIESVAACRGTALVSGQALGPLQVRQLRIEASGQVAGSLDVEQLDVHGRLQGEVRADEVVVRSRGVIDGELSYGQLSTERGGELNGQLQRQPRPRAQARSAVPARAAAPAPAADDTVSLHLPEDVQRQIRLHPERVSLTLADGGAVPGWMALDVSQARLRLQRAAYERFVAEGRSLALRLQAGSEHLVFTLPPEARDA